MQGTGRHIYSKTNYITVSANEELLNRTELTNTYEFGTLTDYRTVIHFEVWNKGTLPMTLKLNNFDNSTIVIAPNEIFETKDYLEVNSVRVVELGSNVSFTAVLP